MVPLLMVVVVVRRAYPDAAKQSGGGVGVSLGRRRVGRMAERVGGRGKITLLA